MPGTYTRLPAADERGYKRRMGNAVGDDVTKKKSPMGIVFLTLFLDMLGFGILIPIQPFYAESFGATPAVITLLGASYSLMQFLFAPFWGRLSDRIGRRPVVLTSVALSVVAFTAFGFATSLPMLFAARMLAGFGNANIGTVQAIVADVTTGKDRAKGMGMVGAAFGLGFIFGPVLGAATVQFGLGTPAFISAGLALLNLILAYARLPETRVVGAPSAARTVWLDFSAVRRASTFVNVPQLLVLGLVVTTGFALMETALALFIERVWVPEAVSATGDVARAAHERAARLTGWVLLAVGVASAIVQGGLIGRLSKAFGERALIRAGIALLALSFVLVPIVGQTGSYALFFPVAILIAVGSGITNPSMSSFLSRAVGRDEQGGVLGLGQSASALGRVFGPAVSGTLFERSIGLPFQVGAALLIVGLAVALFLGRPPADDGAPASGSGGH